MTRTTIFLNTHTFAASQFFNHSANSAAMFGDKLLFATSGGLYESGSDNDGYTDVAGVSTPVPIDAHIVLPIANFGYQGQKSPRSMLLGGRFDGQMQVSITDENGVTQDYVSPEMEDADGTKIALRTDQRSRYFMTKISNVGGSDFS
ncbi:MAG: hypothetical protein EOM03_10810, partial [Clostridia bacterium]|nr:hypothetical protein [Clostridia bacterium]